MRRTEKPLVEGDYRIQKDGEYWQVSRYIKSTWDNTDLYWYFVAHFKYRYQARRYVRNEINKINRLPKAPEYWRA